MSYKLAHDNGKKICFVSRTSMNFELCYIIGRYRPCTVLDLESIESYDPDVLNQYQFFISAGFVGFKEKAINLIKSKLPNSHFVSFIHESANIDPSVQIGQGVRLGPFTNISPKTIIKNFVDMPQYSSIHELRNEVEDLCYISPMTMVGEVKLAKGTWIGIYSKIDNVKTQPYQQFKMFSRVMDVEFEQTGTYKHNRVTDKRNSSELDINS
jgi:bifunctional N-acetylglucosamine-1-phosphate-uridyltransferase/glucosamine-1-phosphate-acetyltransferase GlmU-like protein